jgi:hypothetical protein
MPVIKVKPWSEDQGEFVLIEEEDFNEEVHVLHEPEAEQPKRQRRRRNTESDAE